MNSPFLLMLSMLAASTLVACAPPTHDYIHDAVFKPAPPPSQELLGEWKLSSGNRLKAIPGDITLAIRKTSPLDYASVTVTGFSGINDYDSHAVIDPTQQRFIFSTDIGKTQHWGPLPRQDFEQAYLDALDGVVSYKLASANQLTLLTLKGETLQYNKVAD